MASLVRVWISFEESATPAVYQLGEKTMIVGRETTCDIAILDASVSRNHASITFEEGLFVLRDHGSSNGTFVNGEAVRTHPLVEGDTIRFGEIVFLFQEGEVTEAQAQALQEKRAQNLELTSSQPLSQFSVPPEQNNPVKVLISNSAQSSTGSAHVGKHYTSRTIPISVSKSGSSVSPTKKAQAVGTTSDDAFASYFSGCLGVLGIVPAIIYGHRAIPTNSEAVRNQSRGLTYSYLTLLLWGFGFLFFWIYGDKISVKKEKEHAQAPLTAPSFKDGLNLLQGPILWAPPKKEIEIALGKQPEDPNKLRGFKQIYGDLISHLQNGLIICEPGVVKVIPAMGEKEHLRFVIEDFLTNPNFLNYNSTVVPAKKDPISYFLIPSLSTWMFYARDQNLQPRIERFNGEEFPWRNGYRGMKWMAKSFDFNASQLSQLRFCVILKPSPNFYSLKIETREGTMNSDYNQTYRIKYLPAEYLAIVVYVKESNEVLAIETNPAVYENATDELKARSLIQAAMPTVFNKKPDDDSLTVPSIFKLGNLHDALIKYPLPNAPAK
jgi:pSer/pThr/pTyr-binding forkhead associated (FHA) protein